MCLNTVDKKTRNIKVGYKIFIKARTRFYSIIKHNRSKGYPFNKWIVDTSDSWILSDCCERYKCGFHVYTSKKSAFSKKHSNNVVCKVLVDNIVASGKETSYQLNVGRNHNIVIARKIKIIEELK